MSRSHSLPMPQTLGTKQDKLELWGSRPNARTESDAQNQRKRSRYLRNMFSGGEAAAPDELYRGHPADRVPFGEYTAKMLESLAVCVSLSTPRDFFGQPIPDENALIPAGYTYLAQLAAHDLVQNVGPLPRVGEIYGYLARDYRGERLVLDTIYGGGPASSCLPYALENATETQRWRLRLGHINANEGHGPPMTGQAARDVARANCPYLNESSPRAADARPDALVADARNDDHLVISQLTALFHEFHNIVIAKLREKANRSHGEPDEFTSYLLFLQARKTVAFVFRRVLVEDLLCRLLNSHVYELYRQIWEARGEAFLDDWRDRRVPVEFSHAVYRFGHLMVRSRYELNDITETNLETILDRSSARHPEFLPLSVPWVIEWARFFEMDSQNAPQSSFSIAPPLAMPRELSGDNYFRNPEGRAGGLFYSDLLRGAQAPVRTVASIIAKIRGAGRGPLPKLLDDDVYRRKVIRGWLEAQDAMLEHRGFARHRLSGDEFRALSEDPPLWFFVVFEAAHDQQGQRLGTLGSTVLAEVFFAALRSSADIIEDDDGTRDAIAAVFGTAVPGKMPELIAFIQENGGLRPVSRGP